MIKSLKFHRLISFLFLLSIFMLSLSACSKGDDSEVKVNSFTTEQEYYDYKQVITFAIKFDNKKNYVINAVEINKNTYPVICSDQDYSLVYVTDESLVYTIGKENYTLTSFTYTKTKDKQDSLVTEACSLRCYVVHSLIVTEDIKLNNYAISTESDDERYYINEKISIVMNLDNPSTYKASKVDVKFIGTDENIYSKTIVLFDNNSENEFTRYKFDCDLPETADTYDFTIEKIYYTKNSRLTVSEFKESPKANLEVQKREIEVMSLAIDELNSNNIFTNVNGETYTDEKNAFTVKITLRNQSSVKIKSLIINGQEYIVKDTMISTNTISKVSTIKVGIKMSSGSESGKITSYQISLQAVRFYDKTSNQLTMPVKNNIKLYIYDKIINDASDLNYMKVDEETKTIKGNYILNKNIVVSNTYKGNLFKDYIFDGLFEGNGYAISFDSGMGRIEKPLFEKIGTNGIIKNLNIKFGVFYNSNIFANYNLGTLKNIESSVSVLHQPLSTQNQNIRGGLVGTNEGNIFDILLKNKVEITGSNINNNAYGFSLIADTNNGNINRIVNNIYSVKAGSSMGNCILFLTSRVNNGTINAVVYTLQNIDIEEIKPVMLATDSAEIGEKAVFSDIYLNSDFIEKVGLKNDIQLDTSPHAWWQNITNVVGNIVIPVINWFKGYGEAPDTYSYWITFNQEKCEVEIATPEELGFTTSKESAIAFYSSLLFASSGYDNFWQYNTTQIHFNFKLNN